jgi:hypothetical protein
MITRPARRLERRAGPLLRLPWPWPSLHPRAAAAAARACLRPATLALPRKNAPAARCESKEGHCWASEGSRAVARREQGPRPSPPGLTRKSRAPGVPLRGDWDSRRQGRTRARTQNERQWRPFIEGSPLPRLHPRPARPRRPWRSCRSINSARHGRKNGALSANWPEVSCTVRHGGELLLQGCAQPRCRLRRLKTWSRPLD